MSKVISKKSKKKVSILGIVFYIFILILAAGVIGLFAYTTNGFSSDFKTFYIESNDKRVAEDTNNFSVAENVPIRFDVVYLMDKLNPKQITDYDVAVVGNDNLDDFEFTVDGVATSFFAITDFSSCIHVAKYNKYFTVQVEKFDMQAILDKVYTGKTVVLPAAEYNGDRFRIVVSSFENVNQVNINFGGAVSSIELGQEEIIYD